MCYKQLNKILKVIQMIKFVHIMVFILLISACKNKGEQNNNDVSETSADTSRMKISLAQWSFHRALKEKKMDNLDFAAKAASMGFEGIEYVNQFFKDRAKDTAYLQKMTEKANTAGVKQLLIMIDGEGYLADLNDAKRDTAVKNHYKWVDAAAFLGCHSIRVNAHGEGTGEQVADAAVKGLSALADYATTKNINILVENHGGHSSDGTWLSSVMSRINKPNVGTLPDFGNFCVKKGKDKCDEEYDRYKGVTELMPFAKAVSAKSHDFGELGFETRTDYLRMMEIVKNAGYSGFVGVEYEGDSMGEDEGVMATKKLIEKCFEQLYTPKK